MSTHYYSNACSLYGASMGRPSDAQPAEWELCALHRVPLDRGGYDPGGAYWGAVFSSKDQLWRLQCASGDSYVRAGSRLAAWSKFCRRFGVQIRVRSSDETRTHISAMVEP